MRTEHAAVRQVRLLRHPRQGRLAQVRSAPLGRAHTPVGRAGWGAHRACRHDRHSGRPSGAATSGSPSATRSPVSRSARRTRRWPARIPNGVRASALAHRVHEAQLPARVAGKTSAARPRRGAVMCCPRAGAAASAAAGAAPAAAAKTTAANASAASKTAGANARAAPKPAAASSTAAQTATGAARPAQHRHRPHFKMPHFVRSAVVHIHTVPACITRCTTVVFGCGDIPAETLCCGTTSMHPPIVCPVVRPLRLPRCSACGSSSSSNSEYVARYTPFVLTHAN